jgi:hypothetical protein
VQVPGFRGGGAEGGPEPLPVMAGLVPAIHVFLAALASRRGCPASQTSLRGLRKADRSGRAWRRWPKRAHSTGCIPS